MMEDGDILVIILKAIFPLAWILLWPVQFCVEQMYTSVLSLTFTAFPQARHDLSLNPRNLAMVPPPGKLQTYKDEYDYTGFTLYTDHRKDIARSASSPSFLSSWSTDNSRVIINQFCERINRYYLIHIICMHHSFNYPKLNCSYSLFQPGQYLLVSG